jgi:D-alanyl-D-alanine carboxypeptidase
MQRPADSSCGDVPTVRHPAFTVFLPAAACHGHRASSCHHSAGHCRRARPELAARLPTRPRHLRRVEVNYLGFDGGTHHGALIVNEDLAAEVIAIFEQLLQLRYPIEKIRTVENYPGADDELSMEDNNTSAFNCRDIPGTGRWSQHAFGRAIDLNPLLNPYIDRTGAFQPRNAAPYLDRNRTDPGLLNAGDPAVRVFTDRGWRWGGYWRTPIDYQHFER